MIAPSRSIAAASRASTAASASGWTCIARPSRTARPWARSAARSCGVGVEVGVGRRLARRPPAGAPRPRARTRSARAAAAARRGGLSPLGRAAAARARRARAPPAAPAGRATARGARGAGSSTTPPPSVSGGASDRSTSRSPRERDDRLLQAQLEEARRRARRAAPAPRACRGGRATARRRPAARRAWPRRAPRRRGRWAASASPATTTSPRATSSRVDPGEVERHALARLRALDGDVVHLHARARARGGRRGSTVTSSPRATVPDHSVPVTTVPAPRIVNDAVDVQPQPAGAPARPGDARRRARRAPRAARRARRPVRAETDDRLGVRQQLAPPRRAARAGSARSAFVIATTPALDAERRQHRRVLARLRHHAVVGGDGHQVQVDPGRARRPSCARSARGRARRRPTAAAPTAASAARSRARSRCRARAPPAAGRCRRR